MTLRQNGHPAPESFDPRQPSGSDGPGAPANGSSLVLVLGLAAFAVAGALYARTQRRHAEPSDGASASPARARDDGETARRRYRQLASYTRDIVYFADAQNRIAEANAAAVRAYGFSARELQGLDAATLQPHDTRETAGKAVARARAGETVVLETKHRRKNGAEFPVEMILSGSANDGDGELLAIVRDTSDRQNADDSLTAAYDSAVEASRLKSEFVAAMGHEIRTPMNTMLGMSELMLDTELTSEQRGFSEAVRTAGKTLLGIIDDVLDFTQMESGGPEFELEDVDVPATIESAVAGFAVRAADAGLSLTARIDPKVNSMVSADPTRIRQVLVRLIDNALKFTPSGSVVVSLALEESDAWSTTLRFAVEDSGPGITDEVAKRIFEPFQQADRSLTRRYSGTGLGLPIARQLVELMGGSLHLDSVPGEGSTFSFSVRFDAARSEVPATAASTAGARVLVVDDDPMAREIVDRFLHSWGMEAHVASSGSEALDMLGDAARAGTPYDVAIVDYSMPGGMGGLELGMRIKGDPELEATQLILITAYKDVQQRQAVSAAGFINFLAKPIDRAQLSDCVNKAVRRARSGAAGLRKRRNASSAAGLEKRILLVEDHAINQQLGVRQIKKLGFDAVAVSNGEQALEALAADRYDLVFMDCQMPVMDGFTATRALRTSEEGTGRHVTVVAMTANALVEDRRKCLAAGMDDYLAKPVRVEDLETVIQRWIWDEEALAV